jgi:hypothetical protein
MERLTFDGNFCDISQCRELPCPHGGSCTQRKVWEKLKAYEDTGLTPKLAQETAEFAIWVHENGLEKIKEWIKADKAGRLVVLPCKVGDTLWYVGRDNVPREMELEAPDIRVVCTDEDNLCMATCNRKPDGARVYRLRNDGTDIGKKVFLTREEAEKALEAMKDE